MGGIGVVLQPSAQHSDRDAVPEERPDPVRTQDLYRCTSHSGMEISVGSDQTEPVAGVPDGLFINKDFKYSASIEADDKLILPVEVPERKVLQCVDEPVADGAPG